MKTLSSKWPVGILLLVVLSLTMACSLSTIHIGDNSAQVTVKLKENDINDLIRHSDNTDDPLLDTITRIDMQEGIVRIFGTKDGADGSYDVALSIEEGQLKVEITGVDIEGVDVNDSRVQRLNEKMEKSLAESYDDSKGEVKFESVNVTDEAVTLVVNTQWNGK